jgi:hypothetical protein
MNKKQIQVSVTTGNPYGHVPGHHYHDVEVSIERKPTGRWVVDVLETWGNCQGHDEEHGRNHVVGRGITLDAATDRAIQLASAAKIDQKFLVQSLSQAASEAEEVLETELKAGVAIISQT